MSVQVSLCMIVRNEAANLAECLASVAGLFGEIIIVDTGSTDATRELAIAAGARVYDFPWCDDFSAARNEGLRRATGEWVFWLDADDRLDQENKQRLQQVLSQLPDDNVGFRMQCLCRPRGGGPEGVVFEHIRLFRRLPEIHWQYRVHEQILPAILRTGGSERRTDVVIHHHGYEDPTLHRHKAERNLRLLQLESRDRPQDPFVWFNLGVSCQIAGRLADAIAAWERGLSIPLPEHEYAVKMFSALTQGKFAAGDRSGALQVSRSGRRRFPESIELLFNESIICSALQDWAGAEQCLLTVLNRPAGSIRPGEEESIVEFKARHNLAQLYFDKGRFAEAERHWRILLAAHPDCQPAIAGLRKLPPQIEEARR